MVDHDAPAPPGDDTSGDGPLADPIDDAPAPARPPAELTASGHLRCYLDQLPPNRCVACGISARPDPELHVALCRHHGQRPLLPAALGGILTASTIGFAILHGSENLVQTVAGFVLALLCFGIALQRRAQRRRFAEVDPAAILELADVAPDVRDLVLGLGARPYPRSLPRAHVAR